MDRWVSGRNHTPAKGAASNRGSRVQIPLCPPPYYFLWFFLFISSLSKCLKYTVFKPYYALFLLPVSKIAIIFLNTALVSLK